MQRDACPIEKERRGYSKLKHVYADTHPEVYQSQRWTMSKDMFARSKITEELPTVIRRTHSDKVKWAMTIIHLAKQ